MRANDRCVGLAAPQLGDEVRIVVVDVSEHPRATRHHGLLVLVNPVIKHSSGSEIAREGCLSIPELTANVKRSTEVTVEASDPEGALQSIDAEGFEARALQHEIDHLDGKMFVDYVEDKLTLDQDLAEMRKRLAEEKKNQAGATTSA
jgi:peptide deformylase